MWGKLAAALALISCASASDPLQDADAGKGSTSRKTRATFVAAEIARWNSGLSAADRAEKFAAMGESAEAFLRGTDHLFWADQSGRRELARFGAKTWISGDLHIANLGAYDDDTGTVVLGMNDYDQAVVADYQLDVWRLATSLVLAGRAEGLDEADIEDGVGAFAEAYLDQLDDDRKHDDDDENDRPFTKKDFGGALDDFLGDAAKEDNVGKWLKDGRLDLSSDDLAAVDGDTAAAIAAALPVEVVDVAQRLHAGLGSLGTARYYALTADGAILDVKAVSATFHARGDEDFDPAFVPYDFESKVHALTGGHHDDFDALVVSVATSYADQTEADWKAWK